MALYLHLPHRSRRRRSAVPAVPPSSWQRAATTVEFQGGLRPLIAALELLAGDRYRRPDVGETPDVVVVEPLAADQFGEAAASSPGALIVVWDRRRAATPLDVTRALDGGAAAFVSSENAAVLIGHLDALRRRRRLSAARPA